MELNEQMSMILVFLIFTAAILYATYKSTESNYNKPLARPSTKISLNQLRKIRSDTIHTSSQSIQHTCSKDTDNDTSKAVQSFTESDHKLTQPYSPDAESSDTIYRTFNSDEHFDLHEELRKQHNTVKIVEMLQQNKMWRKSNSEIRIYLLLNHYNYETVFEMLQLKQIIKSLPSSCYQNGEINWSKLQQTRSQ
eukprot:356304_1